MKTKILNIIYKIIAASAIILGAAVLNTCTSPGYKNEIKKSELSFNKSTFYFKKYIVFKMYNKSRSVHNVHHNNGSIDIYGNVVIIKAAGMEFTYHINKRVYCEDNQIYEFYCDNIVLEFDILNKTLTTYEENGSGVVYYIDSTIKSNW